MWNVVMTIHLGEFTFTAKICIILVLFKKKKKGKKRQISSNSLAGPLKCVHFANKCVLEQCSSSGSSPTQMNVNACVCKNRLELFELLNKNHACITQLITWKSGVPAALLKPRCFLCGACEVDVTREFWGFLIYNPQRNRNISPCLGSVFH